ncbi:class I SAM-dependent methyltransferase [Candidatus Woesearchaeota archaeon]|nr:class I SAM-dependent methyltransferase [Candidatus Woesearchaeota archaeon]
MAQSLDFLARAVPKEYAPLIRDARFIRTENTDFSRVIVSGLFDDAFHPELADPDERSALVRTYYPEDFSPADLERIRREEHLRDLGKVLLEQSRDGTVLDLACGGYGSPFEGVSQVFGARRFIGVDLAIGSHSKHSPTFDTHYVRADLLDMIARMPDDYVSVASICGLEEHSEARYANGEYARALETELARVMRKGGVLLLDKVSFYDSPLSPSEHGFVRKDVEFEEDQEISFVFENAK